MKQLLLILSLFTFSVSINAQTNKAGTITQIKGSEIIVKNEDPNSTFVIGEKLKLLTGDKNIVLEVIFPMQTATKCKLIAGSMSKLKVGAVVYSGGLQNSDTASIQKEENPVAPKNYSENISNVKLDDFNTFIGFNGNDTFGKFTRKYGKPTRIDRDGKYDFDTAYWEKTSSSGIELQYLTVSYFKKTNKIVTIIIENCPGDEPLGNTVKLYLLSKRNTDPKINFLDKSESEIENILGNPDIKYQGSYHSVTYEDKESPRRFSLDFSYNDHSKCYSVRIQYFDYNN